MTNAKHTPGPWRLIEPNEKIHWPIVQRKDTGGFIVMTEDVDVSCADARLIAAAPELLEALKGLLADFQAWSRIRGGAGTYRAAMDRIEAAIAKAEGR